MLYNNKILVTGGHGFLGKKIVSLLTTLGYNVLAPSILQLDLCKKPDVCTFFQKNYPDVVINAAAMVGGIQENMDRPAEFFYRNAVMGMNVIEESRQHGVKKFVQVGTACAYPGEASMPLKESDIWNGYPEISNAPYGLAKRMLLEMLRTYRSQYNFNGIYVVPTNLYGPGDRSHHVIPDTIKKIRTAKEWGYKTVVCWGTGQVTRDFLYVDDAARGIVHMMQNYDGSDPVNLATGEEIRLDNLIGWIAELMAYKGEMIFDGHQEMNGQRRRLLDVSRASALGWEAHTALETGLLKTIDWFTLPRQHES